MRQKLYDAAVQKGVLGAVLLLTMRDQHKKHMHPHACKLVSVEARQ
jgi:hypothetical protein